MSETRHPASSPGPEGKKKKEAEDVFVEKTLEVIKWSKERSQTLMLIGIVLVVAAAGIVYYVKYRSSWEEQAVARLEQVQSAMIFGDQETGKADLYQYIEQFEGTVYSMEARLILGQALLEEGTPEEAIEVLAPAVREMASQPIGLQAGFLMAAAYEESNQPEEAERLYLRLANSSSCPSRCSRLFPAPRDSGQPLETRPAPRSSMKRFCRPWRKVIPSEDTGKCASLR